MNALSVREPWLTAIVAGRKTIETRTWQLPAKFVGQPLLLVGSKTPKGGYAGVAACIVDVIKCRPMQPGDEAAALCSWYGKAQSWILHNVRKVKPVPIKGQLGIYQVDDRLIQEIETL